MRWYNALLDGNQHSISNLRITHVVIPSNPRPLGRHRLWKSSRWRTSSVATVCLLITTSDLLKPYVTTCYSNFQDHDFHLFPISLPRVVGPTGCDAGTFHHTQTWNVIKKQTSLPATIQQNWAHSGTVDMTFQLRRNIKLALQVLQTNVGSSSLWCLLLKPCHHPQSSRSRGE